MDSRTTNLTGMVPPKDTHQWIAPFPWDSLTISHAILPLLCAIFITTVIVVIACCLIQKKPKSAGQGRQRRCNTLETSHDLSDHGVYDVIDEVNISTLPLRCNDKLDSNLMIGSQLLRHSKMMNIFTSPPCSSLSLAPTCDVKSLNAQQQTSQGQIWRYPQPVTQFIGQPCLPNQQEWNINCPEKGTEDGRVYETLDRHWTLFNARQKQVSTQFENTTNSPNVVCHESSTKHNHQNTNLYDTFECKPKLAEHISNIECPSFETPDKLCPILRTVSVSSQHNEPNKILCQLTMFKLGGGVQEKPTLIEKAYYHVQPQRNTQDCSHFEEISAMFQSANLRIVQSNLKEPHGKGLDLILKPAKLLGDSMIHLRDKMPHSTFLEKAQSTHRLCHSTDKQPGETSLKMSLCARAVSSDISCIQKPPSICKYLENVQTVECSEIIHRNITKSPEAARISTKLGPLPPLPVQQDEHSQPDLASIINNSNYLHQNESLMPSITSSSISIVNNHTSHNSFVHTAPFRGHFKQMDTEICVSRPQIFSTKSGTVTKEMDATSKPRPTENKMTFRDFRKVSPEIAYLTDMRNSLMNKTEEFGSDNYNDYFVLESAGDISSINSDNQDTPDREY